jgi:preprotein translocase subunit SecD
VLGPVAMELSASDIKSAHAQPIAISGGKEWVVMVQLSAAAATRWDMVAEENFHQLLAIDQDGTVVSAPIIQPTQTSFSSFEGKMEISSLTEHNATSLAAAIDARQ